MGFSLSSIGDSIGNAFSSAGGALGDAGNWLSSNVWEPIGNAGSNASNWAQDVGQFGESWGQDFIDKLKKNPLNGMFMGPGGSFTAGLANKVLGTNFSTPTNIYGLPSQESLQNAQDRGKLSSNAMGALGVGNALAKGFVNANTGGLGSSLFDYGDSLVSGQGNRGDILKNAPLNALTHQAGSVLNNYMATPSPTSVNYLDGASTPNALYNVPGATSTPTIPAGVTSFAKNVGMGALKSGGASALKGGSFLEGAKQGGLTSGLGNAIGAGIDMFTDAPGLQGQNPFSQAQQSQSNNGMGDLFAGGLMGLYNAHQAKKDVNSQIDNLNGLFSPNSAYAQQMEQQLSRKDAAAGRRSQYGPRSVELQARLAQLASGQAGTLNTLYNQKRGLNTSQYKDLYHVLDKSGILNKLGNKGQQYFNSMMGNQPQLGYFNQGQFMGPQQETPTYLGDLLYNQGVA